MKTTQFAVAWVGLGAFLLTSTSALADWSNQIAVNAKVHDHHFDRVALAGETCTVTLKLSFNAPQKAYAAGAKNRNSYLFRARAKLKNGKVLTTEQFRSSSPARRTYSQSFDTSGEDCWGKNKLQVIDVKVVGCRSRRCAVPDFE